MDETEKTTETTTETNVSESSLPDRKEELRVPKESEREVTETTVEKTTETVEE